MVSSSWMNEFFANITRQIDAAGWSVVYVGGGSCDIPGCRTEHESDLVELGLPPYGYTVGLPLRFDHAELVVVGLDQERTVLVLNGIAHAVAEGARLEPDDLLEIEGAPMKVGPCAVSRVRDGLVAVSMDYHWEIGHPSLPNPVQIMWPDPHGRFPGDPRLGRRARRDQPLLSRPRPRR